MTQQARITAGTSALRYRRALVTWVVAYVGIEVIGVAAALILAAIMHTGSYADPAQDPSYIVEDRFMPLVNLVLWTLLALAYFGRRPGSGRSWLTEPIRLGTFWLALALPSDFVFFVAIKNPSSLTAHEFYVEQSPWIYLTYAAVFISPVCAAALRLRRTQSGRSRIASLNRSRRRDRGAHSAGLEGPVHRFRHRGRVADRVLRRPAAAQGRVN